MDELTEEVKAKNKEIKDLKKEIDKRPLPKDVEKTMVVRTSLDCSNRSFISL